MFSVEGRYFPDAIQAFTFAQIQADRMKRPVEIRIQGEWHGTAHPSNYVRSHLVKQPPAILPDAAVA